MVAMVLTVSPAELPASTCHRGLWSLRGGAELTYIHVQYISLEMDNACYGALMGGAVPWSSSLVVVDSRGIREGSKHGREVQYMAGKSAKQNNLCGKRLRHRIPESGSGRLREVV